MKMKQLTGTMTPNKARAIKPTHSESPKAKDTTANELLVEKGKAGSGAPPACRRRLNIDPPC